MKRSASAGSFVLGIGAYGLSGEKEKEQEVDRTAALDNPLLASPEELMRNVGSFVDKADDNIDAFLDRCEACLSNLEKEGHNNAARHGLVKCALAQQLEKHPSASSWSDQQRLRHTQLREAIQLIPLSAESIDQLPSNDVDTVLGVAVQQAAHSPRGPECLTQLIELAKTLQGRGGMRDLLMARSLLNGLGQAMDQLHQIPMDNSAHEAMGSIESRLYDALLTQVKVSAGVTNLWSAVERIGEMDGEEPKGSDGSVEVSDWTCREDVLAVMRSLLRQSGLTFRWAESMTLETWALDASSGDEPRPGLRQELSAVLCAYAAMDGMLLTGHHPFADCLKRWLAQKMDAWSLSEFAWASSEPFQAFLDTKLVERAEAQLMLLMEGKLVGEAQQVGVVRLLQDPEFKEADRSCLMACFAKLLSFPGTSLDTLGWLFLNYAEHIDLVHVLAPIWEPPVSGGTLESGIDRSVRLARRLATDPDRLNELLFNTQDMGGPTAKAWWFLLKFAQFYVDRKEKAVSMVGADPGYDVRVFMGHPGLSNTSQQRRVEFFCDLWMSAAVNGVRHAQLSLEFLVLSRRPYEMKSSAFWSRAYDQLLPLFRPSVRQTLNPPQQLDLLTRRVTEMAIRAPRFPEVKGLIVAKPDQPEAWTDEDFERGAQSVEAYLLKECEDLKQFSVYLKETKQEDGKQEPALFAIDGETFALEIGTFWAELAAMRPQWLESVAPQHPWLRPVIAMANDAEATQEAKNLAIAQMIRQAARERNAKDLG